MIDQPNAQTPSPEKLVLPAYSNEEQPINTNHVKTKVQPEHLIRPGTTSPAPTYAPFPPSTKNYFGKLAYFWRKDHAYKVFMIITCIVLLSGGVFVAFASSALLRSFNALAQSGTSSQNPATVVLPSGTVDLRPSFPTPGGGKGSTTSSQPPAFSTPSFNPTPDITSTPDNTPTPGAGTLSVQITSIPGLVFNGSRVFVGVTASQPGVSVRLLVSYTVSPFSYSSVSGITDANGNASIPWKVQVSKHSFGQVIATVVAIATDQNGHVATSAPVQVQVVVR